MAGKRKSAKPIKEKAATASGVEMSNDEGGVPHEADQSDDTDAKGTPKH